MDDAMTTRRSSRRLLVVSNAGGANEERAVGERRSSRLSRSSSTRRNDDDYDDQKEEVENDVIDDEGEEDLTSPPNGKRGRLQRGDCLTNSSNYLSSRSLRERRGNISYAEPRENDFGTRHSRIHRGYGRSDSDRENSDENDEEGCESGDGGSQLPRRSTRNSSRLASKRELSENDHKFSNRGRKSNQLKKNSSTSEVGSDSEKSLNGSYWRTSSSSRRGRDVVDDQEDDDENFGHKYTFRNRARTQRQTLNISTLGGIDGGYETSNKSKARRRESEDRINYSDTQRLFLGGKLPRHSTGIYRDKKDRYRDHHYHRGRHRRYSNTSRSRRHYDSSSESDSSGSRRSFSGSEEDRRFRKHEYRRIEKELESIQPINAATSLNTAGSIRDKVSRRDLSRADVNPIVVDSNISFDSVGGLDKHIRALKEMVVLPLLYPDIFQKFDAQPPRGTLFIGPPGTGKTLTARALANSLTTSANQGGNKVSFFMRKGADCLSKWVGEGERQLRLLFEQAKKYQPSIIFFDEIDGLAPVRSVKQDQIHASIVSTLLALMDGLDSRGQVVVIGATNRPDAIDPALRRPGRFDRELLFPLPSGKARSTILDINTRSWSPPLCKEIKEWVVRNSVGFCGADLKALCAEATLVAFRRTYPQIYESNQRLTLDSSRISITRGDFAAALRKVVPSSRRSLSLAAKPLDPMRKHLLGASLEVAIKKIKNIFPVSDEVADMHDKDLWISSLTDTQDGNISNIFTPEECSLFSSTSSSSSMEKDVICSTALWNVNSVTSSPCIMIGGARGMGQDDIGAALLHFLESFQVFQLDHNSLVSDPITHSPEYAIVSRVEEALRSAPSVIYLPNIFGWWKLASESMKVALVSVVQDFPSTSSVLWISTVTYEETSVLVRTPSKRSYQLDDTILTDLQHGSPSSSVDNNSNNLLNDERLRCVLCCLADVHATMVGSTKSEDTLETLCRKGNGYIELTAPKDDERHALFDSYFSAVPLIPTKIYLAHKKLHEAKHQNITTVEIESSSSGIRRNLRSSSNTITLTPPKYVKDEKDIYHIRELRVFFRATLHELSKDKRYAIFWRQVDPMSTPDYYDVVKAPMDLETIRMKVDDHFYETKGAFMHDIEQIAFNAKLYNPVSAKDYRSRNIVHVANSLLDVIETHAYNFRKELGSDVFKRCDEIAKRTGYPEPKFGDRMVMHPDNLKYYEEIIAIHHKQKIEMILDDESNEYEGLDSSINLAEKLDLTLKDANMWRCEKCDAINENRVRSCNSCNTKKAMEDGRVTRSETRGSSRDASIDLFDFPDPEPPRKKRITSIETTASASFNFIPINDSRKSDEQGSSKATIDGNCDEGFDNEANESAGTNDETVVTSKFEVESEEKVGSNITISNHNASNLDANALIASEEVVHNVSSESIDAAETTVIPPVMIIGTATHSEVNDFDSSPFIKTLKKSVHTSLQPESTQRLTCLQTHIQKMTKGWSAQSSIALMTGLNKYLRSFQTHADWNLLIDNISTYVTNANTSSVTDHIDS